MSSITGRKSRKSLPPSVDVTEASLTSRSTRARPAHDRPPPPSSTTASASTKAGVHQSKRQTASQSSDIDKTKKARISKGRLVNSASGGKQLRGQSPNKARAETLARPPSASAAPTALHKRKRFKPVAEEGANRPVHNRNKGQRTATISPPPFLEREAEETKGASRSSRGSASKKLKISTIHHQPKTTTSRGIGQPSTSSSGHSQTSRSGQGSRKLKTAALSISSSDSSTSKKKSISHTRRIRTRYATRMAKAKKDSKPPELARDTLPKRKASLDAHSAMLALTLQMQGPSTKGPRRSPTRKRTETVADTAGETVHTVASPSSRVSGRSPSKKYKSASFLEENRKESTRKKTISNSSPAASKKRKTSQPGTPATSPKKPDSIPGAAGAPIPHPHVQCTCQSPPTCPLHYQLHCACHHAQFHQASVQAPPSLISSIFPFSTTAAGGGAHQTASLPHYSTQPWSTPQPWPFPTAHVLATVATPNTSSASTSAVEASALSAGFPAVFQGHLFIGPHPQQANFHLHPTPQSFNQLASTPLFVSTEQCPGLTLHSQPPRHPTPPLLSSCVQSVAEDDCAPDLSPVGNSETTNSDMVATKNKIIYELINQGVDMPSLTMKFAKKTNSETSTSPKPRSAQKRKSSTSSGEIEYGGKKSRKAKSTRKTSFDFGQGASMAASSLWEPVGTATRKWVYVNNDSKPIRRDCYSAIRHKVETDTIIRVRDCIVVKSSDNSQPQQPTTTKRSFIAKVADFFTNPANGSLWVSLVWYYWPEQAEVTSIDDRFLFDNAHAKELLASRHIDCVSVDSIEDVAYVVSLNEYNRYIAENKSESLGNIGSICDELVPRAWGAYPRRRLMPAEDTDDALVYFCRRVYDFHGKRILRNPSF